MGTILFAARTNIVTISAVPNIASDFLPLKTLPVAYSGESTRVVEQYSGLEPPVAGLLFPAEVHGLAVSPLPASLYGKQ